MVIINENTQKQWKRAHQKMCRTYKLPSIRYNISKQETGKKFVCKSDNVNNNSVYSEYVKEKFQELEHPTDNNSCLKQIRRVRFELPPSDSDLTDAHDDGDGVAESTAGEVLSQTCNTVVSHHSDIPSAHKNRFPFIQKEENENVYLFYNYKLGAFVDDASIPLASPPRPKYKVYPFGRYLRGTLSPTPTSVAPSAVSPGGIALLRAARDGDDSTLQDLLRRASLVGISEVDANAVDNSGRTILSYVASNGTVQLLNELLKLPGLNYDLSDNEGNTPLHFVAQAGQVECLNVLVTRCTGIEIDARNNLGFTPLMKAALQGRNKCAKLLLFAGANPTLRDCGRGLRADQWARFCGRYICADVIEKLARQRLLEKSTPYGKWGLETDVNTKIVLGKVLPIPQLPHTDHESDIVAGLRYKLKRVFRSGSSRKTDQFSSAKLITHITSAALCVSTPILPSTPCISPMVKTLIRPLSVPRLQVTLIGNNNDEYIKKIISDGDNQVLQDASEQYVYTENINNSANVMFKK